MTEYIKKNDALEIVKRTCGDYAAAFAEIRKLPAEESWNETARAHASKVTDWLGDVRCSNCQTHVDCTEPFCQHCGAKLDGIEICE